MEKVTLTMKHCYGITSMEHEFDFSNNNMPVAIYAPNGMMKTSLAKSLHDYTEGNLPKDKIFPDKECIFGIVDETGSSVEPGSIFVVDSINEKYQSGKISTLLASEELKKEYDRIFNEIASKKESFLKKLRQKTGIPKKDLEATFTSDYRVPLGNTLPMMARLEREVRSERHLDYGSLDYRKIFNEKVRSFIENPDFKELIAEYTGVYERLIDTSRYFKKGVFNHSNAETIAKNLESNGWFDGGHSVRLNDGKQGIEISTKNELAIAIEREKEAILNDETLKNMFAKVDKALSNVELRKFRDYLIENPSLVSELSDIEHLKDKMWIGYLTQLKEEYFDLIQTYDQNEATLSSLISRAEAEQTRWELVIEIFNRRFSVPFTVRIENKGDAVLNLDSPQIAFYFNNENREPIKKIDRSILDKVLSNGEKRALYILNIIFEVEARKQNQTETLFLVDDIADSFDYKNKYAIIEYLRDIKEEEIFHLVLMTHNYDFFRTVKGRLGIWGENKLLASREPGGITLSKDEVGQNPFINWKKKFDQTNYLIASIPFVRNLAEYTGHEQSFDTLTALLHVKPDSSRITLSDLKSTYKEVLSDQSADSAIDTSELAVDKIFEICSSIVIDTEESVQLEQKIILSIGIRLKAEQLLINKINDENYVNGISKNQTSKLIQKYSKSDNPDERILEVIQKVQLMTPENIHLNSFMFEPILDISIHHLVSLYTDIEGLSS